MTSTATTTTSRKFLRLLAVAIAMFSLAACLNGEQQTTFDLVNQSRAAHGRRALAEDTTATTKAQAWAEHLARRGSLAHSHLPSGMGGGWRYLGENVGYGGSIHAVHNGYMNSPGHKANILNSRFTHMGVGVAKANGRVYTVIVFVQR